ncbi:MAG: long-chain fatty acid--CoA ligase, partial [Gemmatimonadota bacterium]|nr:long-chain fatty acid--CoA ligase [Gemmatimonadota bacterium]
MISSWSLAPLVEQHAREHPERTLAAVADRHWTYGQVDEHATALAASLAELGLGAGDRIAVNLPNVVEWVTSLLACAKLGAVVVPINPQLSIHELRFQMRHAEASAVITVETLNGVDYLQRFEELLGELPDLQYLINVGAHDPWYDDRIFEFESLLERGRGKAVLRATAPDDSADIAVLYTSGTMGKPKGVRLSHRAVVENAVQTSRILEVQSSDRLLALVPFFNIMGFSVLVGTIVPGATLVMQGTFDAARTVSLLQSHQVTVLHGVPTMFHLIMREDAFSANSVGSLRTG